MTCKRSAIWCAAVAAHSVPGPIALQMEYSLVRYRFVVNMASLPQG